MRAYFCLHVQHTCSYSREVHTRTQQVVIGWMGALQPFVVSLTFVGGLLFSEFFSHLQSAVELLIFNVQRHSQGAQQA